MNNKILLTSIFVLITALSIGSIYGSDVNTTDSYTTNLNDSYSQELTVEAYESAVDNDTSGDVLQSDTSSNLSTNTENSNVLTSGDNDSSIDVSKTVISKDVTKYYKGSTKYTATFLDADGIALKNVNVKITVNKVIYNKKTDNNGVASIDINLKPGTYKVVASNPTTDYNLTTTFKILPTITADNVYKVYLDSKKFTAKFYKSNGDVLAKKYIRFEINGKKYNVKTDSKGIAKLSLKYLKKGTYKIKVYNRDGLSITKNVKVIKSAKTSLTTKTYTFLKKDSKKIKVKLRDNYGYELKGKVVKFKINGKTYTDKTNKYGDAEIKLPSSIGSGAYTIKYKFSKSGYYKGSSAKNKVYILPSKTPTFTIKSARTFGHGARTPFKVALTSGSVPLVKKTVIISVNNNSYTKTTDSNGIVSLPINLAIGKYTIYYTNKADSKVNAKTGSATIDVVERCATSMSWKSPNSFYQGTKSCKILLLDSKGKALSGEIVKLTVNSKTYSARTSSGGYATFSISFAIGNYTASYSFDGNDMSAPSSGTTSLVVKKISSVSVANIVKSAASLKSYYEHNKKLPSTVKSGGITFTVPEFLYLMNKAICQLGNSNKNDIAYISNVNAPASPLGDEINSQSLSKANFLKVANNVVNYITDNKQAPNFASSAVGKIIYDELVESSARILTFYGSNNRLPNYVTISYTTGGSSSSQSGTGLNEINTETSLSKYLKSTTHCEVDNPTIKKLVKSLTSGLSSTSDKAEAIFNYVKKTISYSFYYNTKYGAVKTLKFKTGNCVDHSHLLVAMFRTADIHARYVHGTCKFSSGSTFGHVWTQVLIDGKWTVADATSSRNSLGSISNWNTKSFKLKGIYTGIEF